MAETDFPVTPHLCETISINNLILLVALRSSV